MYKGIYEFEKIVDLIEENITDKTDCEALAAHMSMSVYEFRRIFAFVVGVPLSEYIRKRRLSLAALEILSEDKPDILAISEKYGYSGQSAFTRAFHEQHGASPTALLKGGCEINLFTRPVFEMNIGGREDVSFGIVDSESFCIRGYKGVSDITDTCCCENVWNGFYDTETDQKLSSDRIYACYKNLGECVECTVGEVCDLCDDELCCTEIPAGRWVCLKMKTTDETAVNAEYCRLLYEILPSAGLRKKENMPSVEVYPFDMDNEGFEWEIRIPVEKEN